VPARTRSSSGDVDRTGLERLPAGETQQPLHERLGALARLQGAVEQSG
jgi:hypothetical protein